MALPKKGDYIIIKVEDYTQPILCTVIISSRDMLSVQPNHSQNTFYFKGVDFNSYKVVEFGEGLFS